MDGVSAGASVLAFVGVALQSTKVIYQIVSGIGTASQQMKSLASAVRNLEVVLTQLSNCRALADPNANIQEITTLVEACKEDVLRYEKILKELQTTSNSSKLVRKWKKMRTVLKEKDFERIWNEVTHHCTVLVFHLTLLQS